MLKFGGFGVKTSYDIDAFSYMNRVEAAGRTLTSLEKGYIDTLFLGLKSDGIYTILYDAIIPIWGTSAPSVVALKNVATFTAVATPTFSSSGVDFNGTTQYISTNIVPNTHTTTNSVHLSYYSQDDVTSDQCDIGCSTGTNRLQLFTYSSTSGQIMRAYTSTNQMANTRAGGSLGFAIGTRVSSTDLRHFWNGTQTGSTQTAAVGGSRPSQAIYIGAENDDGTATTFSTHKCSFASVGGGLDSTQAGNFTTRVEAFMDSMGIGVI